MPFNKDTDDSHTAYVTKREGGAFTVMALNLGFRSAIKVRSGLRPSHRMKRKMSGDGIIKYLDLSI